MTPGDMMLMKLGAHARALRTSTQMKIDGLRHWVSDAQRELDAATNDDDRTKARRRIERFARPLRHLESIHRTAEALRD